MKRFLFSILFISASVFSSERDESSREASVSSASLQSLARVIQLCVDRCAAAGGEITGLYVNFPTGNLLCECTKPGDDKPDEEGLNASKQVSEMSPILRRLLQGSSYGH